jgi:hypothetical protein
VSVAATALLAGSPTHAATSKAVKMTFSATPAWVSAGASVTLSGRAWAATSGNGARVDLYVQKQGTSAWTLAGSTTPSNAGVYHRTVRASTTGTFRAVYRGNTSRKPATRYDGLLVRVPPPPVSSWSP